MIASGKTRAEDKLGTREFSFKMLLISLSFIAVLSGNVILYQSSTNVDGINTTLVNDQTQPAISSPQEVIL